jgi:DNA helicase IV
VPSNVPSPATPTDSRPARTGSTSANPTAGTGSTSANPTAGTGSTVTDPGGSAGTTSSAGTGSADTGSAGIERAPTSPDEPPDPLRPDVGAERAPTSPDEAPDPLHPDLAAERERLAYAYRCLADMRDRTEAALAAGDSAAQAVDSAIAQAHLAHRLRTLDPSMPGLSFGRIDHEDGERWYVGRRHVEDEAGDPVVVDWRASVSTPFYRATAADAMDLHLRRRFVMSGQELDDLFDEVFDDPDSVHAARHGGIPDPLLAELERARTGAMRDIVSTIQAEQDVVIRASLDTCLVVQGGPGTGKTAVGLHRAAFLLYEHRGTLDDEGVLVVGPNPLFLRYIAQVLPSLGEVAVRQTTIERLLELLVAAPGTGADAGRAAGRVRAVDTDAAARVKGDARMATVLTRALDATITPPTEDLSVPTPWGPVTLTADEMATAIDEIRARGVAHSVGRSALRSRLLRLATQRFVDRRGEDAADPSALDAALRAARPLQSALSRMWPTVSGLTLAKRVLTNRRVLGVAASGVLSADEQALVHRKAARKGEHEPWTAADLVIVDEAEALVNGVARTYGHVVVDEAQDLSAMALRALARRCPSRSMTVLGDLAQATAPAAQQSWDEAVRHLGSPELARIEELTLGYRVPAPVLDFANRLLPSVAPGVSPSQSVRQQGRAPVVVHVDETDRLAAEVAGVVTEQAGRWSSVGVVVPAERWDAVRAALVEAGTGFGEALAEGEKVTLVSPMQAKGLEFDGVVVVEPALVVGGTEAGGRLLYVALTRAVQELTIVHAEPLPEPLRQ